MALPAAKPRLRVMLVSRLITRTSGAASSSTGSASPQGQAKPAGRGIRPWARSARRTYARASAAYLSRSSGSPGCGSTWSTPRPVITSPHKNKVSSPSPTPPTLPGHRQHLATEDPPAAPLILLNAPDNLICARPPGQDEVSRNRPERRVGVRLSKGPSRCRQPADRRSAQHAAVQPDECLCIAVLLFGDVLNELVEAG